MDSSPSHLSATPQNRAILLSCLIGDATSRRHHHEQQHQVNHRPRATSTHSLSLMDSANTPTASTEMKGIEDYLMSELSKLSVHERSTALNDLYCVNDNNGTDSRDHECPILIEKSLAQFELVLQSSNFPIYQVAAEKDRSYVEDTSFRLKFLRANLFDVSASVNQMVDFLTQKAIYFGVDKVARDITLDDLTSDELDLMISGRYHIQDGQTDAKGRVIFYGFGDKLSNCQDVSMVNRIKYYIWFNILIANPVVQKKGLVAVYYDTTNSGDGRVFPELASISKLMQFSASLPIRYSGGHICFVDGSGNNAAKNFFLGAILRAMTHYSRTRITVHRGSHMEIQYQLRMKHGFPDTFPVDTNGKIRQSLLNVWFYLHMANDPAYAETFSQTLVQEEDDSDSAVEDSSDEDEEKNSKENGESNTVAHDHDMNAIDADFAENADGGSTTSDTNSQVLASAPMARSHGEPTVHDVYLGRGKNVQNNPGNVYFREYIARFQDDYDNLPRRKRGKLASDLTNALRSNGVRFFQRRGNDGWEESDLRVAQKKVSQLLREFRKQR